MNWVPLDAIGKAYADMIKVADVLPGFINMVHPQATPWDSIMRGVKAGLSQDLPVVSFQQWVNELEEISRGVTSQGISSVVSKVLILCQKKLTFSNSLESSYCHSSKILRGEPTFHKR